MHNNDAVKYKRKNKMINIKINYAFTVSSCAKCDNNIQEKASRKITTLVLRGVSKLVHSLKSSLSTRVP